MILTAGYNSFNRAIIDYRNFLDLLMLPRSFQIRFTHHRLNVTPTCTVPTLSENLRPIPNLQTIHSTATGKSFIKMVDMVEYI